MYIPSLILTVPYKVGIIPIFLHKEMQAKDIN